MIDLEKLKHAHDLTAKYYEQKRIMTWVEVIVSCIGNLIEYQWTTSQDCLMTCENIDELISKLEEITTPQPKYFIGQTLWGFRADYYPFLKVICARILTRPEIILEGVNVESYNEYIDRHGLHWTEAQLYPDLKSLIKAQIEYWLKLEDEADND